ncbi:MAG: phosphoribosylglycinamide formyltransferase [Chitinophagaceae bacterium]|nr:phosphoribosylglycinamide formyltransferase [Chitinophagaceae bacterium]
MTRIAIFASGTGSNAQKIIEYFKNHRSIIVSLVVCNKPGAGVIDIATQNNIPVLMIDADKERFFRGDGFLPELKSHRINFIVLAGFLWKIPLTLTNAYQDAIINIHPALLPAYGGRGMYGMAVHAAVLRAGEKQSGITIHFVDEQYDNGDIIFQERLDITESDTPETLAEKIHELEHQHFPRIIEQVVTLKGW